VGGSGDSDSDSDSVDDSNKKGDQVLGSVVTSEKAANNNLAPRNSVANNRNYDALICKKQETTTDEEGAGNKNSETKRCALVVGTMPFLPDDDDMLKCANCGKDGDGLKLCNACKEVKYCSVACQKRHRPKHKTHCRKRAAELHDEALFREPPPKEDCPICFLPLPRQNQTSYQTCCGKNLCCGCVYAAYAVSDACPFCREPMPSVAEMHKLTQRRIEANDAVAWQARGMDYTMCDGSFPQDKKKAIKLWYRAAEFGSINAHVSLGHAYANGEGVEVDTKKAKHHWEIAAMGGDDIARTDLALIEGKARNYRRAAKHLVIAASRGHEKALTMVRKQYSIGNGIVTKDEFEKTLRAYIRSL